MVSIAPASPHQSRCYERWRGCVRTDRKGELHHRGRKLVADAILARYGVSTMARVTA
jgi:hypothetical protein